MESCQHPQSESFSPITGYDFQFLQQIRAECETLNPIVIFLLGVNYIRHQREYPKENFIELAKRVKDGVDIENLNAFDQNEIYKELYSQTTLDQVFRLRWFQSEYREFQSELETKVKADHLSFQKKDDYSIIDFLKTPRFPAQDKNTPQQNSCAQNPLSKASYPSHARAQDEVDSNSSSSLIDFGNNSKKQEDNNSSEDDREEDKYDRDNPRVYQRSFQESTGHKRMRTREEHQAQNEHQPWNRVFSRRLLSPDSPSEEQDDSQGTPDGYCFRVPSDEENQSSEESDQPQVSLLRRIGRHQRVEEQDELRTNPVRGSLN